MVEAYVQHKRSHLYCCVIIIMNRQFSHVTVQPCDVHFSSVYHSIFCLCPSACVENKCVHMATTAVSAKTRPGRSHCIVCQSVVDDHYAVLNQWNVPWDMHDVGTENSTCSAEDWSVFKCTRLHAKNPATRRHPRVLPWLLAQRPRHSAIRWHRPCRIWGNAQLLVVSAKFAWLLCL